MNSKPKWVTALGVRRTAVLAGAAGLALGAAVLTAGSALAGVGSEPGNLTLSPASGPLTTSPTWSTTDACPAGFQGSAQLFVYNTDGSLASSISQVQSSGASAFTNVPLLPATTMADVLGVTNATPGGPPVEIALQCASGSGMTGNTENVQSTFVSESADATSYSTSATGPTVTATSTVLTASPNPANTGATVTLTATETAADNTHPAGSVTFFNGSTAINSTPIAVDANGVATTTTTFSSATSFQLKAVFTPTNTTTYGTSTSNAVTEVVNQVGSLTAQNSPVTVSVTVAASGTLTVSVAPNSGVTLTTSADNSSATGTLPNVTVTDTRNTFPGWSVMGQESAFTGSGTAAGASISGDQLGWVPAVVGTLLYGAQVGAAVQPASPGIGTTAAVLAFAPAGSGVGTPGNQFNATLNLAIPAGQKAGDYAGQLSITYLSTHA